MASSSAAVVVVVIVIVLLLLLAFFWCGCGGGSGCSTGHSSKLSRSYVPFSAGGLAGEVDAFTPITSAQYIALGDGNASGAATFAGALELAGGNADSFAAAFTRDGQVRKFTVHAYLASTTAGTVTVGLYISPKSAATQPLFALAQSVTFDTTTSPTYFYSQLTSATNVKAGDRWVVLVTSSVSNGNLYVVSGGFEYAMCGSSC